MKRSRLLGVGVALAVFGLVEFGVALLRLGLLQMAAGDLAALTVGFGPFLELLAAAGGLVNFSYVASAMGAVIPPGGLADARLHVGIGAAAWMIGWALAAHVVRARGQGAVPSPSPAAGHPLHPSLANYVDFYWGTLAAYGFGIFLAEAAFVASYLVLVARGASQGASVEGGLSPVLAFALSLFVALAVAFVGGFGGAANAKRLSTPEATVAVLYFGLPIPAFFTAIHAVPELMRQFGYRLREVIYLSSLLGESRPELGYWLVTVALILALFLGSYVGFVSTASGRLDLRGSYETFIATRHVSVFRWRLLLGVFAVLLLGIIPPLLLLAIVRAADSVVERMRIRRLGLVDPLAAAEAVDALRLKTQTPTAMMTSLSVGGVGVGVMALIIVLSVMSGFEADLQQKILGTNAHGVVLKYGPEMAEYDEVLAKVKAVRQVAGATPFILNEVMVSSEGNISGSMIKGIDPATVGQVTDLPSYILPGGKLEWLEKPAQISAHRLTTSWDGFDDVPATAEKKRAPEDLALDPMLDLAKDEKEPQAVLPGLVLGRELASSLKVVVGDRVNVVSPIGGELGPQGPMPKSRPFRVAGIFYSGMYEYDSKFVYIHLREAATFFNVKGATGIEIKVKDIDDARSTMKTISDALGGWPYRTKDWGEMNRNLFSALRLEKLVMGIILSIIVIVAAGLIVATVIMLVLEKRKEIAVLKALGVPNGGIVKIFLTEGLQIGIAGSVLGLLSGLAWCFFIERVGIKLDPQVYYIPSLPVRIVPFQTMLAVLCAILVTFLASIYPALKASQLEPVEGLKSE